MTSQSSKMAEKVDLVASNPDSFKAPAEPVLVTLSEVLYLAVDGVGDPSGDSFQQAIGALYGAAYTLKLTLKARGRDFKVAPLEGFWWSEHPLSEGAGFMEMIATPRETWKWMAVIMVPAFVTEDDLSEAKAQLAKKDRPAETVRLVTKCEGLCVQTMHVGPFAEEPRTIAGMHDFIRAHDLRPNGWHHEVYLSDPRRTAPERLRTILRQPVAPM